MSVLTTLAALQAAHLTITGIASAPTAMPAALNTATLPIALTFPSAAEWNEQAIGLKRQFREYIIRVYVNPAAQGEGVDEGFQECLPIIQAFGEYYLGHLTLTDAVDHIGDIRDEGIGILPFAGVDYRGFTFHVNVTEK